MHRRSFLPAFAALLAALALAACGGAPTRPAPERTLSDHGREVTMFALSLLDTGYRFGGKNPEAGLDCSGMVTYVFNRAAGLKVTGSAADIARQGRAVDKAALIPGDLVFFDTSNRPFSTISHVGIYIGDGRFIHAPSAASGRVRIDRLSSSYFAPRFTAGRSYFD